MRGGQDYSCSPYDHYSSLFRVWDTHACDLINRLNSIAFCESSMGSFCKSSISVQAFSKRITTPELGTVRKLPPGGPKAPPVPSKTHPDGPSVVRRV